MRDKLTTNRVTFAFEGTETFGAKRAVSVSEAWWESWEACEAMVPDQFHVRGVEALAPWYHGQNLPRARVVVKASPIMYDMSA